MCRCVSLAALVFLSSGCQSTSPDAWSRDEVAEGVRLMAVRLCQDLAREGPEAWLSYFADGPEFFMAYDGSVNFPNIEMATQRVREMDPGVIRLELVLSELRVDVLGRDLAALGASYTEQMVIEGGETLAFEGYLTAVVVRAGAGWKLRNLHWSSPEPTEP